MSAAAILDDILAIAQSKTVSINGTAVPLKSFAGLGKAFPTIWNDIVAGVDAGTVIKDIAPDVLPVVETLANAFFPGAGNAIELLMIVMAFSHKMTPEEEAVWFDRAKGSID